MARNTAPGATLPIRVRSALQRRRLLPQRASRAGQALRRLLLRRRGRNCYCYELRGLDRA